jgi:transcriptional regulator
MYLPTAFRNDDQKLLLDLMRRHPFATLIGVADGAPEIAHIPILAKDEPLRLHGHVARQNPIARLIEAGAPLTAVFHGPHAYISPRYYRTAPNVPTWNYVVVHASGRPRLIDAMPHLREVVDFFEKGAWTVDEAHGARLAPAVVAFEIAVERLEGKLKLNQNRNPEDWAAIVERFERTEPEMVALMKSLGPPG